ncbi:40s ribosomal protein s15 [Verticillium dahliae]
MLSKSPHKAVNHGLRKPHPLEGFLVLAVAPFLGHKDIQALRCTCTTSRRTLDTYERSTARASIGRTPLSGPAPSHHLLTSDTPARYVAPRDTYAALRELEDREREIAFLVDTSPYLRSAFTRTGIKPASRGETRRARAALKRALWICSGLADLETAQWAGPDAVPAFRRHGAPRPAVFRDQASFLRDFADRRAATTALAALREAQLAAVRALPARDLASLIVLGDLATRGFEDQLGTRRMAEYPRHVVNEWNVAVAENVFRHGVHFLRGQARRGTARSSSNKAGGGSAGGMEACAAAAVCDVNAEEAAELKKKRAFRKFSYRGIDLEALLDLDSEQLRDVVHARARRRINRGLKRRPMGLIKKLRKAKQEAKPNEKPDLVKTHLRDMIVVPEMIGSVIGIYSGKEFNQVEIKPEMVGHYLGEFSIS